MQFTYEARDLTGQARNGVIVAERVEDVTQQLRGEGMFVVSVEESDEAATVNEIGLFAKRVTKNEIIYFTNQLAVMVDAGVPVGTLAIGKSGAINAALLAAAVLALSEPAIAAALDDWRAKQTAAIDEVPRDDG